MKRKEVNKMNGDKIIACEMLRPEIEAILKKMGSDDEVIWIEPALHVTPQLLNLRLQEVFDTITDCKRVKMPFGDCGGALKGLVTGDYETIIPNVDDCLTLLLGSMQRRVQISREMPTFYLSLGWVKQKSNIIDAYYDMVEKYGEDTAKMLAETMYGSYKRVALIDTGVGDYFELLSYEKTLKDLFGFEKYPVKGTTAYLEKLFSGPWSDGDFRVIPPHGKL